jgi:hypothetical protein
VAAHEAREAGQRRAAGLQEFVLKGIKEPVEAAEIAWDA